jgi:hypothetical protein
MVVVRSFTEADIKKAAHGMQLDISDAQAKAIAAQCAVYEHADSPAAGLHHIVIERDAFTGLRRTVQVRFHYLHHGLPSNLGLEVTIFGVDGEPVDSQDFG